MTKVYDGGHAARDLARGFMTKHVVKGAAGGIRGADYQDHEAQYLERRDGAAAHNLRASDAERSLAQKMMRAAADGQVKPAIEDAKGAKAITVADKGDGVDQRQVVNVAAAQAETEKVSAKAKLEDEKVKKKLLLQDPEGDLDWDEGDEEEALEEEIEWAGPFADTEVDEILRACDNERINRLVRDPEVEMRVYGTLRLIDPTDMREALGTPLRVARHLRIIAGRMLRSQEFSRQDVVHYLAGSVINLGREYGGAALRSFAVGVGVGEIYPLEVVEHVAGIAPSFVPKTTVAPFMVGRKQIMIRPGKAFTLRIDPGLKITAFALKGGGEPGYQFAPRQNPGEFGLCVLSPGDYQLMLAAVDPYGLERLQELKVIVRDPKADSAAQPEPARAPARAVKTSKLKARPDGKKPGLKKKKLKKKIPPGGKPPRHN